MRILFLSNFFPPLHFGGYEELPAEVADRLRARQHRVDILTSNWRAPATGAESYVHRRLHLEVDMRPGYGTLGFFAGRARRAAANIARLEETVIATRPDVIVVWGMWNVPRGLLAAAEGWGRPPLVYYVSDYWPTLPDGYTLHWRAASRRWWTSAPKRALAWAIERVQPTLPVPRLRFEHAVCVSRAVRTRLTEAGLPFADAAVIYNGIDLSDFPFHPRAERPPRGTLEIGFLGRLAPEKGCDTLLSAMRLLVERDLPVTLTVAARAEPAAIAALHRQIERLGLRQRVSVRPSVPRAGVPALLAELDVVVVPSLWPEPSARVIHEAMASGTAVVATQIGGTLEVVEDGVNGLLFPPGDAPALAERIERLHRDRALRVSLAAAARRTVETRFDLTRTVAELEALLLRVCAEQRASGQSAVPA